MQQQHRRAGPSSTYAIRSPSEVGAYDGAYGKPGRSAKRSSGVRRTSIRHRSQRTAQGSAAEGAGVDARAGAARLSRVKASASARSASRSARSSALRVLTSTTTRPSKPRPASPSSSSAHGCVAAAGHEVLVARRAGAVGDVHVRRAGRPSSPAIVERVGLRHRRVRQVEREVREVLGRRVPVGRVRRDLPAAGPQREHVLHREADVGLVGHLLDAAEELAGVLPLPAERRVHDDGLRAAAPRPRPCARTSLAHGSVPQTRCVMTRHGACSARIGTWW